MFDENQYPTLRFMRCSKCGNVFVASLSGSDECPDCSSEDTKIYRREDSEDDQSDGAEDSK